MGIKEDVINQVSPAALAEPRLESSVVRIPLWPCITCDSTKNVRVIQDTGYSPYQVYEKKVVQGYRVLCSCCLGNVFDITRKSALERWYKENNLLFQEPQ